MVQVSPYTCLQGLMYPQLLTQTLQWITTAHPFPSALHVERYTWLASVALQSIVLEVCTAGGGAIAPNAEVTIRIGEHAGGINRIVNHATPDDHEIVLTTSGSVSDEGRTRIVIIDSVTVTSIVATYLAFSVDGVSTGDIVNADTGDPVSSTSTATTLPFGVVASGDRYVLAQDLSVTTNAQKGFAVTVQAGDDLRASNNAVIDVFADGGANAIPGPWNPPSATAGATTTYGHWGLTTEDATLSDGNSFGDALYAGDFFATPREIMYATSSADGTTAHIGATRVGYKLEISPMQEAADSYTTTLMYVITPVF